MEDDIGLMEVLVLQNVKPKVVWKRIEDHLEKWVLPPGGKLSRSRYRSIVRDGEKGRKTSFKRGKICPPTFPNHRPRFRRNISSLRHPTSATSSWCFLSSTLEKISDLGSEALTEVLLEVGRPRIKMVSRFFGKSKKTATPHEPQPPVTPVETEDEGFTIVGGLPQTQNTRSAPTIYPSLTAYPPGAYRSFQSKLANFKTLLYCLPFRTHWCCIKCRSLLAFATWLALQPSCFAMP